MVQNQRHCDRHNTLTDTPCGHGTGPAHGSNCGVDGYERKRRAAAKSCGGQACRQSPFVRKPFDGIGYRGDINDAAASTGKRAIIDVQVKNGCCKHSAQHPSQKNEHGTDEHEVADTEFIDEVSRDRHRPCFKENKQRIDQRNVRVRHGRELLFQPGCKKREGVLKVRNDDHRHDASSQLNPPVAHDRAQRLFREICPRGVHVCHATSSDKTFLIGPLRSSPAMELA